MMGEKVPAVSIDTQKEVLGLWSRILGAGYILGNQAQHQPVGNTNYSGFDWDARVAGRHGLVDRDYYLRARHHGRASGSNSRESGPMDPKPISMI